MPHFCGDVLFQYVPLAQIFTAAERHGRKVALVGRSMLNVFNAANNLGYIQKKPDTLIEISQVDNYPPEQVVIISTALRASR